MLITKEIFKSYLQCPYKAYLLSLGKSGVKCEYETVFAEIDGKYYIEALKKFGIMEYSFKNIQDQSDGKKGILYRTSIESNGMSASCVFERVSGGSALGSFHYAPVMFSANGNIFREDRMIFAYVGLVLESVQSRRPDFGRLIYGDSSKKVRIGDQMEKARKVVANIKKFDSNVPHLILNRHCHLCEFANACRAKATEKDDLSLLAGIPSKEIEAQNKRGIFTVTQYSYTFRPWKKFRKAYPFNLKALALREQKIHFYGTTVLPISRVQIYFDVEGDPERDFYYLIGVVIVENGIEKKHSFWADSKVEEGANCLAFVNCIRSYRDYRLYHYGSYETKFLQRVKSYANDPEDIRVIERMTENAVNVLSIVYNHVFFPTYSNGLKDIATYLGFKWTSESASGLNSLVWRARFECLKDKVFKSMLITYNLEDCLALKVVVDVLLKIIKTANGASNGDTDFVCADEIKKDSISKWGKVDFVLKDFDYVNNCAYFDYQREKIFVRTNKNLRGVKATRKAKEKRKHKINKKVILSCQPECPECNGKMYRHGYYPRRVFDLKFLNAGIIRWVTIYYTSRARCVKCKKVISSECPENLQKYGHGLINWVIYQNVAGNQSLYQIASMLDDLFGLSLSGSALQRFKKIAAEYYQETYQGIIDKIKRGSFIHVDETQVSFPGVNGYVWVFTNMEEVYFMYTSTREGEFLKELLENFKGVLISDFYGAYCSLEWIQQKCLIHLIRDLNDDLRKNPFDDEYKKMVVDFSLLLRQIIATVDKHGLKKTKLSRHKKNVLNYFRDIFGRNYTSELAQKYQKRFQKNENTLFTFLDYNGIPWNNNNAEHAIKYFAIYRRRMKISGHITERGLKQYLILLSIYQTCQYQDINFMEFLVSKEKIL